MYAIRSYYVEGGGEGRLVHRKAMVLAGDHYRPALHILHRVVGAVVPELHLHRLGTAGEAEKLVRNNFV